RQVPPQPLYSRQNVERSAYTNGEQRVNQLPYDHRDHDRCSFHRAFVIRYDERLESNRNAGFARRRRSLSKSANSRQADCEPVSIASRAGAAVFRGFQPDEWIFGTEIGLLRKEPYLLSVGFINWSPHLNVDPQPFIEAGYYTEHHKIIAGAIHADYKNEAILGYAYDFNERWRVQVDW